MAALSARQDLGQDLVDPELGGDPLGGLPVVAGEHHRRDAQASFQRCDRRSWPSRAGVGDRDQTGWLAIDGDVDDRAPGARELRRLESPSPSSEICSRSSRRRLPTQRRGLRRSPAHRARDRLNWVRAREVAPPAWAALTIASARGCSLSLDRGDETEQFAPRRPRRPAISTTSGSPCVSVPVLSRTTVSRSADCSIAIAFLNRIPRGAEAGADHDRGRRRQAERVRAGDHDDGDREQERVERRPTTNPYQTRNVASRRRERPARARRPPDRPGAVPAPSSSAPPGRA